jgi:hypothetical protein
MIARFRAAAIAATLLAAAHASAIGAQDVLPLIGPGGTSFSQVCPKAFVLTGIRARRSATLDAIGIRCRPVKADGNLGPEIDEGPVWGGPGGIATARSCQANYVIAEQIARFSDNAITELRYLCYRWNPATRTWNPRDAGAALVVLPDGPASGSGSRGTSTRCPVATRPADGVRGRSDTVVDAVGIRCDAP